ncbi:hypothetical protein GALMADRAFT_238677 [Galerina marginata CBS 339.88]|uniref:F-box domain-containing protein n=1 Tax=Galerina marginata (strain CBS 339.88) TaxID=685588 RepID=A0A067TVH2_GALM3|nr:hypothetical protein GALMADRAFT_238677 [Galerina marginata CBS 339.88]
MAFHIPQEVVDLCVDHLASDMKDNLDLKCDVRQALLFCSQVSRSISHRARQHLFQRIRLTSRRKGLQALKLHDIMNENPQFRSYIRSVEINVNVDDGADKAATTASRLPEILNMLTDTNSRRKGVHAFRIHATTNCLPWSKLSNEFLSALLKLIHGNTTQPESNDSKMLKSLHISGFREVPVAVITNCISSLRDLDIQFLSFVEAPPAIRLTRPRTRAAKANQPLDLLPPASPSFRLNKYHFTGLLRGNINELSTHLLQSGAFSCLKDLEIFPFESSDTKFVCDVVELAKTTLESLKLHMTPAMAPLLGVPAIDLCQLPLLRIVKIVAFILGRIPSRYPTFSLFDLETKTTTSSLEVFELILGVTTDERTELAIYSSDHRWDRLDQYLTSSRFPKLRQVDLKIQIMIFAQLTDIRKTAVKKKIDEEFRTNLPLLYSSDTITLNIGINIVKDWNY